MIHKIVVGRDPIGSPHDRHLGAAILTHDYVNKRDADVRIGNNCFSGAHSIILPSATIGDSCIVAAPSVVARDVPSGSLATGNPARVVAQTVTTTYYGVRAPRVT